MPQYHVTLNGQGYLLDLDRYQKRIHEPFVARQSQGTVGFDDLRGPEQVLVISDWSGGEGYTQHDTARPERWRRGTGLDGYTMPGSLRLGPPHTIASQFFNAYTVLATYKGKQYVGADQPGIYVWDGSTYGLAVATAAGRVPASAAVFLNRLYLGNSGDGTVTSFDGTTWTAVAFTLAAGKALALASHYRQAAEYLYVAANGGGTNGTCRIVYWDGAVLSSCQLDLEEPNCYAMVPLGQRLYLFSADAASRIGAIYSVDDSGSGGVWRFHQRLFGNYFTAACLFDGAIYVGCGRDGEIYRWDGTTLDLAFRLSARDSVYTAEIKGMAEWDGALWVAISDGAGATGLLRYDGSGWSRPVVGIGGSAPGYLGVYGTQLGVTTAQATNLSTYGRTDRATYRASGQLESGLIACGLPGVAKLFKSVTLVTAPLVSPQSVQVEYRLEDSSGAWTSLGTLATVGATTATYSFAANTTGRQIAFRLTLSGTNGVATSPVLYALALRYVPRPALTRAWELAVALEGTAELPLVTLDGAPETLTGAQLTAALWTAAGVAGPVTLVDLDGASYSVYVQDIREEIGKLSQRRGYQRLGIVKLVEAA